MIEEEDKYDETNHDRDDSHEMETSRIAAIDVQERERFNSLVKNSTIIRRSFNTTRYSHSLSRFLARLLTMFAAVRFMLKTLL